MTDLELPAKLSRPSAAFGLGALLMLAVGCWDRNGESETPSSPIATGPFVDRAEETGLDFVHDAGRTGRFYFPEIQGAGSALLDYDNDGDLDAFLVQSGSVEAPGMSADKTKPAVGRLYRNDLEVDSQGRRSLRFTDVTERSEIRTHGYGQGIAVGDYDNDGWPDIFVSNFASLELWRNDGDGTFSETTKSAGVASALWNSSSTFFDFDRDGWLDLYVATYTDFTLARNKRCTRTGGSQDYCGPMSYGDQPDQLFRNRGDGTFENVSAKAGILTEGGPGLGVVAVDPDADGWLDLWVANDEKPNFLWHNQRNGTFKNTAVLSGCAVDRNGLPHSGMGVDVGDSDNDGDEDLYVTNMLNEYNTFYENDGHGLFEDRTIEVGLAAPTLPFTGFGTAFLDYDNDGWLDILVVNGAVQAQEALVRAGNPFPYHQRNQLFRNKGDGTYADVTEESGEPFRRQEVGRGASFGDVDNDGDTDVLVTNDDGPARLLINTVGQSKSWLGLRLLGAREKRDMYGAMITLVLPDGKRLLRRVRADGSYQSANEPRVLVGLGAHDAVKAVHVKWPDGAAEEFVDVRARAYTTLTQGTGRALSAAR